jgi:glycosyltransferase involved in cell wall biosynthesis
VRGLSHETRFHWILGRRRDPPNRAELIVGSAVGGWHPRQTRSLEMSPSVGDRPLTDPPRREFVFVFEQALGHVVHGTNLERRLAREPDISATVIRVKHADSRLVSRLPIVRSWSFEASWATRSALKNRLDNGRADAVFIHTQASALLAAGVIRSVPTIISMDATPMNYDSVGSSYGHIRQGPALEWMKRRVNRHAMTTANAIVTWSHWAADSVVRDYGISSRKVHVIRPGVNLQRFRPGSGNPGRGAVRILFVGVDFARKGGEDLLEAMRDLGDVAELDIITMSPPPYIASDLPVRVHLGLSHDSPKLYDLYQSADVFVLPSRSECYGLVICEALASGLPVVACNVGAVPELVIDGHNGLLVPPGAVGDLAQALRELALNPDLRATMGARGLAMALEEHDADHNARKVFELMRQLADGAA